MTQASQVAEPSQSSHAPGRKRDASRDDALCQAALEVLADVGYDRLTVDAVAARAGAGKATCYRRWAGKPELVVEAVSRMKAQPQLPATGSPPRPLLELTLPAVRPEPPPQPQTGPSSPCARRQPSSSPRGGAGPCPSPPSPSGWWSPPAPS